MVENGQLQVSKTDSPQQGKPRDTDTPRIQRRVGSAGPVEGEAALEGNSTSKH